MGIPESRRPPLRTAVQADAKQCRKASKAFLKALRALPDTTPNATQLLQRVSQHVRSDIPEGHIRGLRPAGAWGNRGRFPCHPAHPWAKIGVPPLTVLVELP